GRRRQRELFRVPPLPRALRGGAGWRGDPPGGGGRRPAAGADPAPGRHGRARRSRGADRRQPARIAGRCCLARPGPHGRDPHHGTLASGSDHCPALTVLALAVTLLSLQSIPQPLAAPLPPGPRLSGPPLHPADPLRALRVGLDTLYGGDFEAAAGYFAALAAREPTDPAPIVFQAGAYIWWASARDSADFALQTIDSLLGAAMGRARALPGGSGDFWLATALGYRARQREEHGHGYSAARDAKAMRDIYRRLLAADSSCIDCYLGLGVY